MKGMVDESIEADLKALDREEGFAVAHNNLAIAYLEKKNYELAIKHGDKARELGYDIAPEILKEIDGYRK